MAGETHESDNNNNLSCLSHHPRRLYTNQKSPRNKRDLTPNLLPTYKTIPHGHTTVRLSVMGPGQGGDGGLVALFV